jgi:hypothetical protein
LPPDLAQPHDAALLSDLELHTEDDELFSRKDSDGSGFGCRGPELQASGIAAQSGVQQETTLREWSAQA